MHFKKHLKVVIIIRVKLNLNPNKQNIPHLQLERIKINNK